MLIPHIGGISFPFNSSSIGS